MLTLFTQLSTAQVSTCACSNTTLQCVTPGQFTFTTTTNTKYQILTSFQETCVNGIAFVPSIVDTRTQCACQNDQKGHMCGDIKSMGQVLYYPMKDTTKNGQSPSGQYCFFGNYATCQMLRLKGTFYETAKHCFSQTNYYGVNMNGIPLTTGQYTQTTSCAQSDLPYGYLSLDQYQNNQTIIDYTSTGLNTNGVWFVPETDQRFADVKIAMQQYIAGQPTLMKNWMFQSFNQETSIPDQPCNTVQDLAIKLVAPSKISACSVFTSIIAANNGCFQMTNCSTLIGMQGTYQYSDQYFQIYSTAQTCNLNGQIINYGLAQFNLNSTALFFSTKPGSCQFAFQNTTNTTTEPQANCYFMPTDGQIGKLTDENSKKVSRTQSVADFFLVGLIILVSICVLIAVCMICKNNHESFSHESFEGTEIEKKVYSMVDHKTHTLLNSALYLMSSTAAILAALLYDHNEDLMLTYYLLLFSVAMFIHHSVSGHYNFPQSTASDSAMFLIGLLVTVFAKVYLSFIGMLVGIYSYYGDYIDKSHNVVRRIVLTQNSFFLFYSIYYYVQVGNKKCIGITSNIVNWTLYGVVVFSVYFSARRQNLNLLIVSINMLLATHYMTMSFDYEYCGSGAWTKTFMSVDIITALIIAIYSVAMFGLKKLDRSETTDSEGMMFMKINH